MANAAKIGLIELPFMGLYDSDGGDWMSPQRFYMPLTSKQVLLPNLQDGGFDARLVNLKEDEGNVEFGHINWKGMDLIQTYSGKKIEDMDRDEYDCWGVTAHMGVEREVACMMVKHLSAGGKPVVAGGSDAIANPEEYIRAGASAVVLDKSGAVNCAVLDYALGNTPRHELGKVMLADGSRPSAKIGIMSPEDWPLPSVKVAQECFGRLHLPDELLPTGSVIPDIGCDRNCNFCQTSTYKLGYLTMSPETTLKWAEIQKKAGAKTICLDSDQFLARQLRPEGRNDILEIMKGIREMGLSFLFTNGLELKKLTMGRGLSGRKDNSEPDHELIETLVSWDGKSGCCFLYAPAERPVFGRKDYKKLLPWQDHCRMMRTIVRTGTPLIIYGVLIGFPDESAESLSLAEESVAELREELLSINPNLKFVIYPYGLSPIPGTIQEGNIKKSGLLAFDDPYLSGAWTPNVNTHHLTYEQIWEGQMRLRAISTYKHRKEAHKLDESW